MGDRPPGWMRALPMLGRPPAGITRAQFSLLGMVALALVFENYDVATILNAAPYIRQTFEVPQSELGRLLAWVRLGALPAVLLVPLGDRIGRRRLFLLCLIGTSLGSLLTMLAPELWTFLAAQVLVRTFLVAGSAAAFVIVAEELPAEHRGWAVGYLGALALLGFGLGALLFSAVKILPFGWRALYAPGVIPLLLLPLFARTIPETRRFDRGRAERERASGLAGFLVPYATLLREYPGRTLLLSVMAFLSWVAQGGAGNLLGDYVQTDRGWSPGQFSLLVICGGGIGIAGNTIAGRLCDRMGRRVVGAVLLAAIPLAVAVVYTASSGVLVGGYIAMIFASTGTTTILRALSAELFPTAARGTAAGSLTAFEALGAASGLYLVSELTPAGETVSVAVRALAVLAVVPALLALLLPETAGRELEDITGEGR